MDHPGTKKYEAFRVLAYWQHLCGPRAIFEFLAEIRGERIFSKTVANFTKIDPANFVALTAIMGRGAE